MSPTRRTDILLLSALAILHLSMGEISRTVQDWRVVSWTVTIVYLIIMIVIYWRFNRDRSSILQTVSYWSVFVSFIITERVAILVERTDLLAGIGVRLAVFVPVYIYWTVSKD